jgi:hypothetical protein
VASWLTQIGLPKAANCKSNVWTDRNVIELIRRPDYRGFQVYRDCFSKKVHSTGIHKPEPNEADDTLTREMPKLRIVEDSIWYVAYDAIDARAPNVAALCGRDNPQYGIPRNSRTPLARVFRCCCGEKIWVDGCGKASYRCRDVRRGECWCKATVLRDKTHAWLRGAIVPPLQSLGGQVDALIEQAGKTLDDAGAIEARRAHLQEKKIKLEKVAKRLGRAIAHSSKESDTLVKMLEDRENRLARIEAVLDSLQRKAIRCAPPTRAEIENRLSEVIAAVEKMDRTSQDEIKQLVGEIRTVPCQQFGTNKVVLRARFELRLAALLPARLRGVLKSLCDGPVYKQFECIPMLVDLFEPSTGPKYGREALRLKEEENLGLPAIGRRLGITKRRADLAVEYGRVMQVAGITDPYIELTEAPAAASRWRPRGYRESHPKMNTP